MTSDFTITFRIKIEKNPAWRENDSQINFPPFTMDEGIQVYFSKISSCLKVYILHPVLGYRKLVADIKKYLQNDAFIALTNTDEESKLYINAELVTTVKKHDSISNLEIGDYVLVEVKNGDLKNMTISDNVTAPMPAKIIKVTESNVELYFFSINESAILNKDRLKI